jgi:DNA polymerase (family X)
MIGRNRGMKNHEIAGIFSRMGDLLEILGENAFRVNSYRNAARTIEELTEDLESLRESGTLSNIAGIGDRTQQKIEEYLQAGKISAYEELLQKVPSGLPELLRIPGMGPKTVSMVWKNLGVEDLEGLQKMIRTGQLEKMAGMGPKKVDHIIKGIEFLARSRGRTTLGVAWPVAKDIVAGLLKIPGVRQAQPAGSLRRWAETIGDIDILIEAQNGQAALQTFVKFESVKEVLALGETKASVRLVDDLQVDVRVVPKESYGAALLYFTGSKNHNIRLRELAIKKKYKLNEYGLFSDDTAVAGKTEEEVFAKLGLPWIAPELREDRGEIEQANALPKLITAEDIRGDLHMHTKASDGSCSIEEMIEGCIARGYKYMCISEHSPSSKVANGLEPDRLAGHIKAVRKAGEKYKKEIHVLIGSEVDILAEGKLDYENEILADLDFVIASIHSALGQPAEKITNRLLRAMDNRYVRMLGHPTGRLLGQREASNVDLSAIIHQAVETGTWLELNASWLRLDLNDVHCRQAKEAGAKIVICTDAHDVPQLDQMVYGVHTARRGWIEAKDVVNTLSADKIVSTLQRSKK